MSYKVVPAGTPMPAKPVPAPAVAPPAAAALAPTEPHSPSTTVPPAPQAPAAPEAKVDGELSPKFAELARKEASIRNVATTLQKQRQQLEADKAALAKSHVPKERLTQDPLAVLAEAGLTPDTILEKLIAAGAKPPGQAPTPAPSESPLAAEIAALKAELDSIKNASKTQTDTAYSNALKQIERDASKLVETAPDYPTIKARGAVKDVVELIEKQFKASGEIMSVADASKLVEAELIEEGLKWASLESIKAKLAPAAPATETPAQPNAPVATSGNRRNGMPAKIVPSGPQTRTITHSLTASTKPESARDRAIRAMTGNKG